jgi:hypothetical protein
LFDLLDIVYTQFDSRIADVSSDVISLSAYAADVSANIATVSEDVIELSTELEDLSIYAH